jgi:GH35 family endo-1,4-beta-xylanase
MMNNLRSIPLCLGLILAAITLPIGAENAVTNGDFADGTDGWKTSKQHPFETEVVAVTDAKVGSGQALKLTVATPPAKPWNVQLRQPLDGSLARGQPVTFKAWLRSDESVDVSLALQMTSAPFSPVLFKRVKLSPTWKPFDFSGKASADADGVQVVLTAGFAAGSVELTGVEVDFGTPPEAPEAPAEPAGVDPDELPPLDAQAFDHPGLTDVLPDSPRSLVGPLAKLKIWNKAGDAEVVAGQVLRLTTHRPTEWTFKVQAINPSLAPINRGDTLLALVRWRTQTPNDLIGYASLGVLVEQLAAPHFKELSRLVTSSDGQWKQLVLPFTATRDYAAGEAGLILRVGYGPQAVEVSHAALVNLGPGVDAASLPQTRQTYGGAEPDAPWRSAAAERIAQHRTGTIDIEVVDEAGRPVPDAEVHVEMTRHDFGFGSALSVHAFPGGRNDGDAATYLDTAAELFNWGVMENAMKWTLADDPYFQSQLDTALSWMRDQDFTIRGHTIVWPSFSRTPKSLQALAGKPEQLRAAMDERVVNTAERFAGIVHAWDVINEPYKKRDILDLIGGDGVMKDWLRMTRAADPDAELFLNDFQILSDPSASPVRATYYLELIDGFQAEGVPIDGMGMQGHFSGELTPIDQILARLDRFAERGLKVHITEFDIATDDEQLQADYTRDFLTACYSHPAVEAVLFWGFWEGQMFQKKGALFRKDWSIKPVGEAFRQLVHHDWKTRATLTTGADGRASRQGHTGTYRVTTRIGGNRVEESFELTADGQTVRLSPQAEPH